MTANDTRTWRDVPKAGPALERAILELFSRVDRLGSRAAADSLFLNGKAASSYDAQICVGHANMSHLLESSSGFADFKITKKGLDRLAELVYQDMTRTSRAAATDILAEMDLPE